MSPLQCGRDGDGVAVTRRVRIYDPCGPIADPALGPPTAPPTRPDSVRGLRIGVLDNGKPNADVLLATLAEELVLRHGAVPGLITTKGAGANAATPARPDVLDRLSKEVDVTLVGSAD